MSGARPSRNCYQRFQVIHRTKLEAAPVQQLSDSYNNKLKSGLLARMLKCGKSARGEVRASNTFSPVGGQIFNQP